MGRRLSWALLALLALGCADGRSYEQAIAVLIDTSGTYADQRAEVVRMVKSEVLPHMVPGDTFLGVAIDDSSYEKDNVIALVTLDHRPSHANAQKLALARKLDAFAARETSSAYTDIPGAMMLAAEYLRESEAGSRVMLVFSDLQEDLPAGEHRTLRKDEFAGIQVIAMNVKHLRRDSADPEVFRRRVETWQQRVAASGGAGWRTLLDASRLPEQLAQAR
jgi:hypothetical protein